jgi:hypothetical protein
MNQNGEISEANSAPERAEMAADSWENVFVRDAKTKSRLDIDEIRHCIKAPFETDSSSSGGFLRRPSGKWMSVFRLRRQKWLSVFCNAANGQELFATSAKNRRLEIVHVGYDTVKRGWCFQLNRTGSIAVKFELPLRYSNQLQKARLDVLPENHRSPLMATLLHLPSPAARACVETLVELGCSVDVTPDGESVLAGCVDSGLTEEHAVEMLDALLALGADIDGCNGSALFVAVTHNRTKIIRFLIDRGADPTVGCEQRLSTANWLREKIEESDGSHQRQRMFREMLSLVTGMPIDEPGI